MPTPSTSFDISVVIVAWNAKHYLELCLDSLAKVPPRRSMEVLVVDNASADGTIEMIEAKFPWVKLIKSPENLGFSKGNNVAIRQAQGRYIALVNPDVIVFPGCLDALADFLDQKMGSGRNDESVSGIIKNQPRTAAIGRLERGRSEVGVTKAHYMKFVGQMVEIRKSHDRFGRGGFVGDGEQRYRPVLVAPNPFR